MRITVLCSSVALALALGCGSRGPTLFPVTGTVLVADKPATGAILVFHPADQTAADSPRPVGKVDAEGKFSLSTDQQIGAPAGEYKVTVLWREEKTSPFDPEPVDQLGGAYASVKSSNLRVTVESGPTELPPFRLER